MDRLIYTAMTGAKGTMDQQAAVAHNLANATSTGFRAELHKLRAVEVQTEALRTRAFTVDASVANNFDQGALQHTGRAYDVALAGKGWLAVQMPDGSEAYTRNGSLDVSANGKDLYRCEFGRAGDRYTVRVKDNVSSEDEILKHLMS